MKKYSLILFCLLILTTSASAQWFINGASDLQTIGNIAGTPYNNVVVNSQLSIGLNSSTCPLMGGGTGSFPLVVNDVNSSIAGVAIVLWDSVADPVEK